MRWYYGVIPRTLSFFLCLASYLVVDSQQKNNNNNNNNDTGLA